MATLAERLRDRTREADRALVDQGDDAWVRCHACAHECRIPDGAEGVCRVRFNHGGRLMAPWGYIAGAQADPIEKKPFFHVRPGAIAYSFGMLGCDFHCAFCQNWLSSQVLRDPEAGASLLDTDSGHLVAAALRARAAAVISTYNEPLITVEWAVEVFRHARDAGLLTGFVSNGHASPRVLDYLAPWIDLYKVDLKCFDDRTYRKLGGRLQPVLDTIERLHADGIWVEVVTLLVPGLNDTDEELRRLTGFVRDVSPDIPWHVTAFYPGYRMQDGPATTPAMLEHAAEIARRIGLRYVYAGNRPGSVGSLEHTRCPSCGTCVVERCGFLVSAVRITPRGTCPSCDTPIPGRWHPSDPGARPRGA